MGVPNTTTFSLQDVVNVVNPSENSLNGCINDAVEDLYDTTYYTSPATSLYEFRNYANFVMFVGIYSNDAVRIYGDGTTERTDDFGPPFLSAASLNSDYDPVNKVLVARNNNASTNVLYCHDMSSTSIPINNVVRTDPVNIKFVPSTNRWFYSTNGATNFYYETAGAYNSLTSWNNIMSGVPNAGYMYDVTWMDSGDFDYVFTTSAGEIVTVPALGGNGNERFDSGTDVYYQVSVVNNTILFWYQTDEIRYASTNYSGLTIGSGLEATGYNILQETHNDSFSTSNVYIVTSNGKLWRVYVPYNAGSDPSGYDWTPSGYYVNDAYCASDALYVSCRNISTSVNYIIKFDYYFSSSWSVVVNLGSKTLDKIWKY